MRRCTEAMSAVKKAEERVAQPPFCLSEKGRSNASNVALKSLFKLAEASGWGELRWMFTRVLARSAGLPKADPYAQGLAKEPQEPSCSRSPKRQRVTPRLLRD